MIPYLGYARNRHEIGPMGRLPDAESGAGSVVHEHGMGRRSAHAQTDTPRPCRWLALPPARRLETEIPRAGQNGGLPMDRAYDIMSAELRGGDARAIAARMCTTHDPPTLWWKCKECGCLVQA